MKKVLTILLLIGLLTACGSTTGGTETINKKEESAKFSLEVTISQFPSAGESLEITSTLTYTGEETIFLMHGEPIIRTALIDTSTNSVINPMMYTEVMAETKIENGHIFKEMDEIEIPSKGTYQLEVYTTTLFHQDQSLGKLSIDPISLEID